MSNQLTVSEKIPRLSPGPDPRRGFSPMSQGESTVELQPQRALIALRRIIRATDLHSKRVRRESGLTVPQVVLLQAIRVLGEVSGRQLAEEVSLSQATVSTILDRLEGRGYVRRYRNPHDRRVVHVKLTPLGQKTLERAPPLLHVRFIEALERLPARERKAILDSLERVAEMMGADSVDAAPLLDVQASPADGASNGGDLREPRDLREDLEES